MFENFIIEWLKDILVVFIVISFLEIILPKGKMKKFVNFIIGLLIIFVIISPFANLEAVGFNVDFYTNQYMDIEHNQRIIDSQEVRIKEIFTSSISEEIKNVIEDNSDFEVINVAVDTSQQEDTILIKEIAITVIRDKDNHKGQVSIEKVQLKESNLNGIEREDNNIRDLVADYLELDRNIVYVIEKIRRLRWKNS